MLKVAKNVNLTATSQVEVDGAAKVIGYLNANIGENGNVNTSTNITDRSLYEAHKAVYKADRAEFDEYVDSLIDAEQED